MTWRYTRTRWLLFIALSLLCWTSTGATNYNAVESDDEILYAIFKNRFKETIEVMYFLMDDMKLYKITSNDENKIKIPFWELKKEFNQSGHEISDIIVIIHNHMGQANFSPDDIIVYRTFKSEGFAGRFCLYVYRTKTIYELAEKFK